MIEFADHLKKIHKVEDKDAAKIDEEQSEKLKEHILAKTKVEAHPKNLPSQYNSVDRKIL